jgi:hypothetical protein
MIKERRTTMTNDDDDDKIAALDKSLAEAVAEIERLQLLGVADDDEDGDDLSDAEIAAQATLEADFIEELERLERKGKLDAQVLANIRQTLAIKDKLLMLLKAKKKPN